MSIFAQFLCLTGEKGTVLPTDRPRIGPQRKELDPFPARGQDICSLEPRRFDELHLKVNWKLFYSSFL